MYGNTLFPVSVHAMTSIAALTLEAGSAPARASTIARSIDTHVVLVRRLLGRLAKANLVVPVRGAEGGYRLAKSASQIRLSEILVALGDDSIFPMHPKQGNPHCPVSRSIKNALTPIVGEAQAKLIRQLSTHRLSDLLP